MFYKGRPFKLCLSSKYWVMIMTAMLAFGSANPCTEESFLDGSYTTYYGRAQAVVHVKDADCRVTVTGSGLHTVTQELN